jgi:hypothetical protein
MDFKAKKGQVTVFIIVGIVILFLTALILFINNQFLKGGISSEADVQLATVPEQFKTINAYTEQCLEEVSRNGLVLLGQQGGYIYPNTVGDYSVSSPTDSDGINLESAQIPYWHYNVEPNSANGIKYSSLRPALTIKEDAGMSIEAQLKRYVEENLDSCLNNYTNFQQQAYNFEIEGNKVQVFISEDGVGFLLDKKVVVNKDDAEHTINQFYVKLPIRLKHYYEVAQEIAEAELNNSFLELQALDLVISNTRVDYNALPPMETFKASDSYITPITWSTQMVDRKIGQLLTANIPTLRYYSANNFYRYDYDDVLTYQDLFQKTYDNMIVPLETAQNINVNFDYFNWPIYTSYNDIGGIIKPSSMDQKYMFFEFHSQRYHTSYDLSYPVMVTLDDPSALKGQGYQFVFALESNIRTNNIPDADFEKITSSGGTESLACNDNQKNTEIIKTLIIDGSTGEPLDAVTIGFQIPNQEDCFLGATNELGVYEDNYPTVIGGVGSYMKSDYLTAFYPIDTYDYKNSPGIIGYALAGYPNNVIELYPYKRINITIKKKNLIKCVDDQCYGTGVFGAGNGQLITSYKPEGMDINHSWKFLNTIGTLGDNETATLILERVGSLKEDVYNDEFVTAAQINGNLNFETELVPGKYSVQIILVDKNGFIIPESKRKSSGKTIEFGQQNITEFITGMVSWETEREYLEITPENLYGSNRIEFYVPGFNLINIPDSARVMEDLSALGNSSQTTKILRKQLEPSYK